VVAATSMEIMKPIDYFARTDTVHIATELPDAHEVVTPIWAVVVDGVPYIRSGYGPDSKWYRRLQRAGMATFVDGTDRYPVTIENLDDAALNEKVDTAYRTKYAGQGMSLESMVAPQARAYTMRVSLR
jgi:hypothetical protein